MNTYIVNYKNKEGDTAEMHVAKDIYSLIHLVTCLKVPNTNPLDRESQVRDAIKAFSNVTHITEKIQVPNTEGPGHTFREGLTYFTNIRNNKLMIEYSLG